MFYKSNSKNGMVRFILTLERMFYKENIILERNPISHEQKK